MKGDDDVNYVKRIDTVFVPVTNMIASEKWYLSTFPFKVGYRSSDGQYVGFRFDNKQGNLQTALTIYKVDKMPDRNHMAFNFYCEDIDGFHSYLSKQDYQVGEIDGGEGMRFFDLFDPDGNGLGIVTF